MHQFKKSLLPLLKHPAVIPALLVLLIYQYSLIFNAYQTQEQLKIAADAQFFLESKQATNLLGALFDEKIRTVANIAHGQEIENFLANQSLGMSMQYGLGASLDAVEQRMHKSVLSASNVNQFGFYRMDFLGLNEKPIIDTLNNLKGLPSHRPQSFPDGVSLDATENVFVVQQTVLYRGVKQGKMQGFFKLDGLKAFINADLKKITGGEAFLQFGDTGAIPLNGASLNQASISALLRDQNIRTRNQSNSAEIFPEHLRSGNFEAYKSPIIGTPFSLILIAPTSALYGHITSNTYLILAGVFPALLFLLGLFFVRVQLRAKQLEIHINETTKTKERLSGQNNLLTQEISRRKTLEMELRGSEERYRTYIEYAPEGVLIINSLGVIVEANPSFCLMTGYAKSELIHKTTNILSRSNDAVKFDALIKLNGEKNIQLKEVMIQKKNGESAIINLQVILLPNNLTMCFCVDVTQQKRDAEQIHSLAYYDPLTGLPNRRLLYERLRQALLTSGRTGDWGILIMLDLDHFKNLNDTLGHDMGDRLLKMTANRLKACMRENDLVSRLGGDEFVILAEHLADDKMAAAQEAEKIALKLIKELNAPYLLDEKSPEYHISCSFGVSIFSGQSENVDALLKQADLALYQAKNSGRNDFKFFNPQMQAIINESTRMESALRRAIKDGEFELYCQPQVDQFERVIGGEVLLRWIPKGSDPISPDQFIALAERSGLIVEIGEWILEKSFEQLHQWQQVDRTKHLSLSINISGKQFHQPNFVEMVTSKIEKYQLDTSKLTLELTESSVLERVDEAISRMKELRKMGVQFSLDDFGTGFSSLSYLKLLPLDQVKIDQSFVRDISYDNDDAAIVRAILAMSQSLDLEVIAEGVETIEQKDFLLKYGCTLFQGYFYGRPVPIKSFFT